FLRPLRRRMLPRCTATVGIIGTIDVAGRSFERDHPSGHAYDHGMVRYIVRDDTIGPDRNVISHSHGSDDLRSWSDVAVPADHRRPFAPSAIGLSDRHSLADVAVVSDDRALIDHDVADVADVESRPDRSRMWNRATEFVFITGEQPHGEP